MEERELLTVELEVFRVERGHGRFVFGVVLHVVLRIERCGMKIAALLAFRRSQGTTRGRRPVQPHASGRKTAGATGAHMRYGGIVRLNDRNKG